MSGKHGGRTATLEPEELDDEYFMMRVRIDGGRMQRLQIHKLPFRIGRRPDLELVLTTSSVSKNHAEIFASGGALFVRDLQTGTTTLVSANLAGTDSGNGNSSLPTISGDGRYVAFQSTATNLVASGPTDGRSHIYVRDLATGATTLVGLDSAGGLLQGQNAAISQDGTAVVFLVPGSPGQPSQIDVRDGYGFVSWLSP